MDYEAVVSEICAEYPISRNYIYALNDNKAKVVVMDKNRENVAKQRQIYAVRHLNKHLVTKFVNFTRDKRLGLKKIYLEEKLGQLPKL